MLGKQFGSKKESAKANRLRLPSIDHLPALSHISSLYAAAELNRGSCCELPLRLGNTSFLLCCQSAANSSDLTWSLFAGEDVSSKVWSYVNMDQGFLLDLVEMSCVEQQVTPPVNLE